MPPDVRVCFLGDSFVAGVGDPEHRGWAARLAARSEGAGQQLTTYNLGVRRETSRAVLARWRAECEPRLPAGVEGRVVVSFGVNDTTIENGSPRVRTPDSSAHLAGVLEEVTGSTPWSAFVVGPPPVGDGEQNHRTADLDDAFAHVCARAGVPYVSVLPVLLRSESWMQQVREGDGSHPAATGYAELADLVWPHWRAWLGAQS